MISEIGNALEISKSRTDTEEKNESGKKHSSRKVNTEENRQMEAIMYVHV